MSDNRRSMSQTDDFYRDRPLAVSGRVGLLFADFRFIGIAVLSILGAITTGCRTRGAEMASPVAAIARPSGGTLDAWVDSVRRQHNIPALAAIVFRADTVLARGISGVRRTDMQTPIELHDRFQLGSNTKAMTAALLGSLVEEGRLAWTTTLADIFPELRDSMSAEFRGVTFPLLLSHHAGISPFKKSSTIRPVGVGFTSWSPTGAVGFTITTGNPFLANSSAVCSAINFDRL